MFALGDSCTGCSPALPRMAQEQRCGGRKLSDALTQADVDTLGACQARVEGMGRLVDAVPGLAGAEWPCRAAGQRP